MPFFYNMLFFMINCLFFALLLAIPAKGQKIKFSAKIVLSDQDERFGGFSGLHIFADGNRFLALSDRGHFMYGNIIRQDGIINEVEFETLVPVLQINGEETARFTADSEGLAITEDGYILVSFEGFHRIRRYQDIYSAAENIIGHADFAKLESNYSLESLAVDSAGAIYIIPEKSTDNMFFPIYRFKDNLWKTVGHIHKRDDFLIVGADFAADGRLYVLERSFNLFRGGFFVSRVRSFHLTVSGLTNEIVHLETKAGEHDNLEGISVWRDRQGHMRITMISDDNFSIWQQTELVEYIIIVPP